MRKPAFCICENKGADQLRGNREADQRLCFRYTDSTIPLLSKYEITSLQPYSVTVQPGLCLTWSETPKTGFLKTRLNYCFSIRPICLNSWVIHQYFECPKVWIFFFFGNTYFSKAQMQEYSTAQEFVLNENKPCNI